MALEKAYFGGGCFWCAEAGYRLIEGVTNVKAGYAGGDSDEKPKYEDLHTGKSNDAEVVEVTFDADKITYREILEILWTLHDPTQLNRQGPDVGEEYRSLILYVDDTQKKKAEKSIKDNQKYFDKPIVTLVQPLGKFFEAEDYHQDFYNKNPQNSYCQVVINPKLDKLRKKHQDKLKK
ncbi:MAG: peptide-methionine (S)-S-oxide reductase MsrA [bacterium]|nr:peptide-methionine (S)-S-oxide reductase MsrA [bacterium]